MTEVAMASIRQNASTDRIPDWRNLGVIARVLIAVNALTLVFVFAVTPGVEQVVQRFTQTALVVEPMLLLAVVVLYATSPWLSRLPYLFACAAVIAIVVGIASSVHGFA